MLLKVSGIEPKMLWLELRYAEQKTAKKSNTVSNLMMTTSTSSCFLIVMVNGPSLIRKTFLVEMEKVSDMDLR